MKILVYLLVSLMSLAVKAAPQYTLQQICAQYGKYGQCQSVPFCQEKVFQSGCYLAQGAPTYLEGLCQSQTQKQGCGLLQAQGSCVWLEQSVSSCNAKAQSL